jgi:hypothetical protein
LEKCVNKREKLMPFNKNEALEKSQKKNAFIFFDIKFYKDKQSREPVKEFIDRLSSCIKTLISEAL